MLSSPEVVSNHLTPPSTGAGHIRVTTAPEVASAITVDGEPAGMWSIDWLEVEPGAHEVCFGDVEGFVTPDCQSVHVKPGETTLSIGEFSALASLQIVTEPARPSSIVIDGVVHEQWGTWVDVPAGTYEVCAVWDGGSVCDPAVVAQAGETVTVAFASP